MNHGKFITLEGIEGSGKSLQVRLLCEELAKKGVPVHATLEPGGTPFGREIRKVLLRADGAQREPMAELLLYLADRFQHLKEVIEPKLTQGITVVSDRYHDATLAYQGFARGLGLERIERLSEILRIRKPDLTLVLDIDARTGLLRARSRNEETNSQEFGRFEAEALSFHEDVRKGYRELVRMDPERVVLVDGAGTPAEVLARVLAIVEGRL